MINGAGKPRVGLRAPKSLLTSRRVIIIFACTPTGLPLRRVRDYTEWKIRIAKKKHETKFSQYIAIIGLSNKLTLSSFQYLILLSDDVIL